ncbi:MULTISPECIES: DUF397 domain-containing protein [unclassified Streptomyces]|uniref:DUF397 domain-containing protein n=1 Tax=unclassified Streptomyces TaxID=2593676 RepID=UPI0008DE2A72|nr:MULTISPECIES: DUF397 domain-containing protein [unclassified Streptomyces]OII67847.1 hypothetical protein BJP39_06120 [Streptomyces sp. CC77]
MTEPTTWQKSSFSGADNNQNCIHVRLTANDTIELVESETPETVVTTSRTNFSAFLLGAKAGEFDDLIEGTRQGLSSNVTPTSEVMPG